MTSLQEFRREQQRIASSITRLRAEQERLEAEKVELRRAASTILGKAARSVGIQADLATTPTGRPRRKRATNGEGAAE